MTDFLKKTLHALTGKPGRSIWDIDLNQLARLPALGIRTARIAALIWKKFKEDELPLRATVLTLTTLMSLAPLLVIAYAMLKGLGFGTDILDRLIMMTAELPVEMQGFVKQVVTSVEQTEFSKLGGAGALILFVMVVQTLSTIEKSFNRVWSISKNRAWVQKVTHYVSIVVIVPVLIATSLTMSAQLNLEILERSGAIRLLPGLVTWIALSFLYLYMPNTRVRIYPALAGAALVTVAWLLWFRVYITLQPGVTRLNVLYGTLASVPIFLAWLYVGWMIVLMGAVVTYAFQTHHTFADNNRAVKLRPRAQFHIALDLLLCAERVFRRKAQPLTVESYVIKTSAHVYDVREVVEKLVTAGWLGEVQSEGEDDQLTLTCDLEQISLEQLLATIAGAIPEDLNLVSQPSVRIQMEEFLSQGIAHKTVADLAPGIDMKDEEQIDKVTP